MSQPNGIHTSTLPEPVPRRSAAFAPTPDALSLDSDTEDETPIKKPKSRRPGDNAFRQQRLRAFNPVFTGKTVIPLLVLIAIIFVPLGAGMWYALHVVQDITIDYTQCENMATDSWLDIPSNYTTFNFKLKTAEPARAVWKLTSDEENLEDLRVCLVQFELVDDWKAPVYLFYRLRNFHANHRRYVKSYSEAQITGDAALLDLIENASGQNCQPLFKGEDGRAIYPCGLIANSLFNDTFSPILTLVNGSLDASDYEMTGKGIAWGTDKNRFKKTKYNHTQIVPPPNWIKQFPNGYNETNVPDVSTWEDFQNWMRPAALADFVKLRLRNDNDVLKKGIYEVQIGLHFPVIPYDGQKYLYLSQRLVIGGKNDFLGISWMVAGGICFILSMLLLVVNLVRPRKSGDVNLLSWNQESFAKDERDDREEKK